MMLDGVIRMLTEAHEAALDEDERLARELPPHEREMGVMFPLATVADLILALQAAQRHHETFKRRAQRLAVVTMVVAGVSMAVSLFNLWARW